MAFALLRPGVVRSCALSFAQPRCALKLKTKGVEYYWLDYPYEKMHEKFSYFDRTQYRLNDNSRSICVEGNVAVGKGTLAKNLAETFYLKYVPDVSDEDFFIDKNYEPALDYRDYNRVLPENLQFYTTEKLFTDSDPIHHGKPLYLQQNYYMYRCYNYWKSCAHLFNTGQGFVMKRSPFSTFVFAKAMAECGLMSADATEWFLYYEKYVESALMFPHLFVYVRSPLSLSRENLGRRAVKWESGVTDKFLQVVQQVYESEFLPKMARYSEIYTVDAADYKFDDANDITYLAEEMAKIDLDQKQLSTDIDTKLIHWRHANFNKDTKHMYRDHFATSEFIVSRMMGIQVPDDLPEGGLTMLQAYKVRQLLKQDPRQVQWSSLNPWDAKSTVDVVLGKTRKDPTQLRYWWDEDSLKFMAYFRSFGYHRRNIKPPFRTD